MNCYLGDMEMKFTINYDIPETVAKTLQQHWHDMARINLEDIAAIGYKTGILTSYQVQLMLNHGSRWETEAFLHKHRCHLSYDENDFIRDGEVMKDIPDNKSPQ